MSDLECNRCCKIFLYPSQLIRHQNCKLDCKNTSLHISQTSKVINGGEDLQSLKKFQCKYCYKFLATKFSMERHTNVCKCKIQDDMLKQNSKLDNNPNNNPNNDIDKLRLLFNDIGNLFNSAINEEQKTNISYVFRNLFNHHNHSKTNTSVNLEPISQKIS